MNDAFVNLETVPEPNPFVAKMEAYQVVPQEAWHQKNRNDVLKLDWNEATGFNPVLNKKIAKLLLEPEMLFWYPDVNCTELTRAIAEQFALTPPEVLVFAGSDEALEAICATYLLPGDVVGIVHPSYDNFRIHVEKIGAIVLPVLFENPFVFEVDKVIAEYQKNENRLKLIYLTSPNNPTGQEIDQAMIVAILRRFPKTPVIIDEAYADFAEHSAIQLTRAYPNLIIAKSFSKAYALAGLRIGYTISDMRNHRHIVKVRNGKNVSMLAQRAARLMLDAEDEVCQHIRQIKDARDWFIKTMREEQAAVYDSSANFVMIKVPQPKELLVHFRRLGIYVRDRSWIKQLEGMVRITIGYQKQMVKVVEAFRALDRKIWLAKGEKNETISAKF